jgi:hypothetical protein
VGSAPTITDRPIVLLELNLSQCHLAERPHCRTTARSWQTHRLCQWAALGGNAVLVANSENAASNKNPA